MKKRERIIMILCLLLLPTFVYAKSSSITDNYAEIVFIEFFLTIHSSIFFLLPLSKIIKPRGIIKTSFWKLFKYRIFILVILVWLIGDYATYIDVASIFIGGFILLPIALHKKIGNNLNFDSNVVYLRKSLNNPVQLGENSNFEIKCPMCGITLTNNAKFCTGCGKPIDINNLVIVKKGSNVDLTKSKKLVVPSALDNMYYLEDEELLDKFIQKELDKAGYNPKHKIVPEEIIRRKTILNIIFSILVFVFLSMIFFHFPIWSYLIGIVILIVFFKKTRQFNTFQYLKKQVKSRPNEKVSNIIMSFMNANVQDKSFISLLAGIGAALVLVLIIFSRPVILYEKMDNGYGVRYYAFSYTNFTNVNIPEKHNGENVVSLRGNAFSNMPFLKKVVLPDTMTEIRGQAFKNCLSLEEVNIPKNLEYLGGGAFENAIKIKSIELPDTLTYLGGDSFNGATSLEYVKLPNNLTEIRGGTFANCKSLKSIDIPKSVTKIGGEAFQNATSLESIVLPDNLEEIRGNTFENCTSLTSINIPDTVTRIGGHAFYGDSSLSEVKISENSQLKEIGSSAFRRCTSLYEISVPIDTSINLRAFKESPTSVSRFVRKYDFEFEHPYKIK